MIKIGDRFKIGKVVCVVGRGYALAPLTQGTIGSFAPMGGSDSEQATNLQQLLDDLGAVPVKRKFHWEVNGMRFEHGFNQDENFYVFLKIPEEFHDGSGGPNFTRWAEKYAVKVYDDEEDVTA